ncbi:MAG: copper chaperone PCu(A)C [Acidimicrobiales bacterium]
MNRRTFLTAAVALGTASLVLAACGDDTDEAATTTAAPATASIKVEGIWARNSPAMATAGAAYMTITSSADDALVGVDVDPSIAGEAQMHETVMAEGGSDTTMAMSDTTMAMSDTTAEGMTATTMAGMGAMQMQQVDKIALPAGQAVALAPGGYHIMLMELAKPLEIGQTFTLTLRFQSGSTQDVSVEVREDAP